MHELLLACLMQAAAEHLSSRRRRPCTIHRMTRTSALLPRYWRCATKQSSNSSILREHITSNRVRLGVTLCLKHVHGLPVPRVGVVHDMWRGIYAPAVMAAMILYAACG